MGVWSSDTWPKCCCMSREARSSGNGSLNKHTSRPVEIKMGSLELGGFWVEKRFAWDIINLKTRLAMAMFAKSVRCLGSQLFIIGRVHLHGANGDRVDLL